MSWNKKKLETIIQFKNGKKRPNSSGTIPVYGGNGILGYTNESNYKDCIIVGRVGAYCGSVYYEPFECWISDNAIAGQPKNDTDISYAYYLLSSLQLNRRHIGTGQPLLTQSILNGIECLIPDIETQKKISGFLGTIDQKIYLNEEVNKNLEQQAMALFRAWFIDYSPFQGQIPSDWKKYKLGEFLPVITGKKNVNVSSDHGEYPFFSCSQDIAWTDEYSFEGNAILVAGNGDFNVKFYSGKFEAYQRTYVLIPYNPRFTAWLFYAVKHNLDLITVAARGSVIKFITKGNLEDFAFHAPVDLDNCAIIDHFTAINNQIAENRTENSKLAELRNALLPRLMSGELDVSDIDL